MIAAYQTEKKKALCACLCAGSAVLVSNCLRMGTRSIRLTCFGCCDWEAFGLTWLVSGGGVVGSPASLCSGERVSVLGSCFITRVCIASGQLSAVDVEVEVEVDGRRLSVVGRPRKADIVWPERLRVRA